MSLDAEKVRLGVTPTLWWNDDFLSIDIGIPFEQCVSEMALAGFQGCSVGHKYPKDPKVLREALDLHQLVDLDGAIFADAAEVVAAKIHEHDVFGAFFFAG